MPSDSRNLPEQEQSIKARSHELFVDHAPAESGRGSKAFLEYLRETPAEPLSTPTKVLLWLAAIIVSILFVAAIWRVTRRSVPKQQPPRATATSLQNARSGPLSAS
jgi:hypothetical protein